MNTNYSNNNSIMVSIICLTYNHEPYIKQCLDGFVKQSTDFQFEVIIHEDCSTDRTRNVIDEYVNKNPNIIIPYYEKENQYSKGCDSRKLMLYQLLHKAQGKYIALCEGDDYWIDDNKLQIQVDFMEMHPDYGMCFHESGIYNEVLNRITGSFKRYSNSREVPLDKIILNSGSFVPTNSICFKKELLTKAPDIVFDQYVGDYPLQMYLALSAKVYYIAKCMSVYRINHNGSWSTQSYGEKDFEKFKPLIEKEMKIYRDFAKYYPSYSNVFERRKKYS